MAKEITLTEDIAVFDNNGNEVLWIDMEYPKSCGDNYFHVCVKLPNTKVDAQINLRLTGYNIEGMKQSEKPLLELFTGDDATKLVRQADHVGGFYKVEHAFAD